MRRTPRGVPEDHRGLGGIFKDGGIFHQLGFRFRRLNCRVVRKNR